MRHLTAAFIALLLLAGLSACYRRDQGGSSSPHSHSHGSISTLGRSDGERGSSGGSLGVGGELPRPTLARDLGTGGGGERLGSRQWSRDPAAPPPGFASTQAPGGDASTFGLDVDTAGFTRLRAMLELGQLSGAEGVRIEELINRPSYAYAAPAAGAEHPLAMATAVMACPWQPEHLLLRVAVRAQTLDRETRPPLNLVFLVDVSGSMGVADRLPLAQRTLTSIARGLRADDRIAIVAYAGSDRVVLEAVAGDAQRQIRTAIADLTAGGSTAGEAGITRAYREAARHHRRGVQSRIVLCTDGDFNVGIRDPRALERFIAEQAASGIYLTVLGYGGAMGNDATAKALAGRGNGVYRAITDQAESDRFADTTLDGELVTVAKDAKGQLFFNPAAISAWRQIGYEYRQLERQDFNDDRRDAGDIGAGHRVTMLYELVPARLAADPNPFIAADRPAQVAADALLRVRLRYQPAEGGASRLIERDVPNRAGDGDGDLRLAAALAGMGMLLREPRAEQRGRLDWALVQRLAGATGTTVPRQEQREIQAMIERAATLADRR